MRLETIRKTNNVVQIKLVSETYSDIALLYNIGINVKKPVITYGGFTDNSVYCWINIPIRKNEQWGFNNDSNK